MNERYFIDNNKKRWVPKVTLYHAGRIKRALGLNIENIDDVTTMIQDPATLVDTLFIACEQEAKQSGISDVEFGTALGGDSIKHARRALLFAISDFFEDTKKRTVFSAMIKTMEEEGNKNIELLFNSLEMSKEQIRKHGRKWRQELEAELKKEAAGKLPEKPVSKTSGKSSTDSPVS